MSRKTIARNDILSGSHDGMSNATATLLRMLCTMRPHGSEAEKQFIARYLTPLGCKPDAFGNMVKIIGAGSKVLWSSHTDTVHRKGGVQRVVYGDGIVTADSSDCLGADCTVGVWLMRSMILAKVPGTYVFHRGEEVGGLGSAWIAKHNRAWLESHKFAIAFDRMGCDEIITHQGWQRTASDAFAESFAAMMPELKLSASDGGTFTDTANYSAIVPECSNIAVGYRMQHSAKESLSVRFASRLRAALLKADFSKLVCARDPAEIESFAWERDLDNRDWRDWRDMRDDARVMRFPDPRLVAYVRQNPDVIAELLESDGYDLLTVMRMAYVKDTTTY